MHMSREPIDKVILSAVRLVGDDDDIAPRAQNGIPISLFLGKEFLNGCKNHSTGLNSKLFAQIGPTLDLDRWLPQKILTARERTKKLAVEVVAVGDHDNRWVLHRGLSNNAPGIEGHGKALPRTLSMPNDADPAVPRLTSGLMT
jgi:hypothetical protein